MHHLQCQKCSLATFVTKMIQLFCIWLKIQGSSHTVGEKMLCNFDSSSVLAMDCH
jgi:hypothetical protein